MERIETGLEEEPLAKTLVNMVREGKTRRFWLEDDILYSKGNRVLHTKVGQLADGAHQRVPRLWVGHPRTKRTLALLKGTYYWPQMHDNVEAFVKTCLVCQQDKIEQKSSGRLLEPLPIPKRPWESIFMDYITSLPKS